MATGLYFDYDPDEFYVWQPPSSALSIHVSLAVIKRLAQECLHAIRQEVPPELAGVLLGYSVTTPHPASFIEDFVLLEDGDRTSRPAGPRESLEERLGKLARKARLDHKTIGFFRAQCGGWLSLEDRDVDAANRYFSGPDDVILLIRYTDTRGNDGALYWRENGVIPVKQPCSEFPLDVTKLTKKGGGKPHAAPKPAAPPSVQTKPPAQPRELLAPKQPPPPLDPPPPPPPPIDFREPVKWGALLPTAAVAMILTGSAVVAYTSPGQVELDVATAPLASEESPLGLSVASRGGQLIIQWNKKSETISAAEKGFVRISDRSGTEVAELDRQQLRDGYVAYGPSSPDASIHFEVKRRDGGLVTESVRYLDASKKP